MSYRNDDIVHCETAFDLAELLASALQAVSGGIDDEVTVSAPRTGPDAQSIRLEVGVPSGARFGVEVRRLQ